MKLADGLARMGFRKWYERELLQSHAHLLLTFLCMVGVIAAFEAAWQFRGWIDQLVDAAAIVVCGAVGIWALRRYLYLLMHAESVANQADCPSCGTYGRFKMVSSHAAGLRIDVQCRSCEHRWTIDS